MKKNRIDWLIILLFLCWVLYSILVSIPFYKGIGDVIVGVCYVLMLSSVCRNTPMEYKSVRVDSLRYGMGTVLAMLTAIKITELYSDKDLISEVNVIGAFFFAVCLQSVAFLIMKKRKLES